MFLRRICPSPCTVVFKRRYTTGNLPSSPLTSNSLTNNSLTNSSLNAAVSAENTPKLEDVEFGEFVGELFGQGVQVIQTGMESIHSLGLPWLATIVTTGALLRLAILPLRLWTLTQHPKLQLAHQDVTNSLPALRLTHRTKPNFRLAVLQTWSAALRHRESTPFRLLTPLLGHLPLFVGVGAALRRMEVDGWEIGLWGWDLGAPCGWLTMIVVASNVGTVWWLFKSSSRRWIFWAAQSLNIISAIFLAMLPASVNFFVLVNNGFILLESSLLKSRVIRRILTKT